MGYDHSLDNPPPDDPSAAPDAFAQQLNALYRQYYRRDATPAEVAAHRGNPAGLNGVETMLKLSQAGPNPEAAPLWPQTTPATGGGGRDGGTGGGGSGAPPPAVGAPAATGSAPTFNAPGYTKPPAFSYGDFVAPDPNTLDQDPMYRDTLRREQDAIQRSATARGVLNTGGTVDSLLRNAKDIAATGYAGMFNRDLSTYQTNRSGALNTYNTNYGTQYTDPYKYNYMTAQDQYNSNQHNYDLSQQYGWYGRLFDHQKDQDLFNNKYKLLSL